MNKSYSGPPGGPPPPAGIINDMTEYIVFGVVAIIANMIVLYVLLRNKTLFSKSALIAGLALADIINGFALVSNGTVRILQALDGSAKTSVHPSYCVKTFVTPLFLLGNQIPGVMFFLVGSERFVATRFFKWYYCRWSNKLAWILTGLAYGYSLCSVGVSFPIAYTMKSNYTTGIFCAIFNVVGYPYGTYNYCVPIVGGTLAVITTIGAMITFIVRRSRLQETAEASLKNHIKNQLDISKVMVCLAILDFGLVVVPNLLISLAEVIKYNSGPLRGWSLQIVALRSSLNIIIYLVVNTEFRSAARKAFRCKKEPAVAPASNQRISTNSLRIKNQISKNLQKD